MFRLADVVPLVRKKVTDENIIQALLKKLALEDKCKNCKKYTCLVDKDVTERYRILIFDGYEPMTFFMTSSDS